MKIYKLVVAVLILTLQLGCSNKQIYDAVQYNQKRECLNEPYPQQSECIEEHSKSFEEYERNREEVLQKDS